jgi:hypothetical protein
VLIESRSILLSSGFPEGYIQPPWFGTSLTLEEATAVASEFLLVDDWEFDQTAIPRFLNGFVNLFPDEIYSLLLAVSRVLSRREPTADLAFVPSV